MKDSSSEFVSNGVAQQAQALPHASRLETAIWSLLAWGHRSGKASRMLRPWSWYERFAKQVWRAPTVPNSPYGIPRFRMIPFRGEPIVLPDETTINGGSLICELHLDNSVLLRLQTGAKVNVMSAFRTELRNMAEWIASENLTDVQALHGVSILAPLFVRLAGFPSQPCVLHKTHLFKRPRRASCARRP